MKPITLNLASRPFRNNTLVAAVLTFVGASLVGMTAYNLYVYMGYGSAYARLQQDQANDRAKIARLQVEERRLADEVRARNFRHAYERGQLASELVRKSAFSWTRLFNTLESVVPPDVVTTAIRPNIGADQIDLRIEGVAKSSAAFLNFQERLMQSPWFTRVFPGSERKLNPSLPDITFLLTCNYLPEGMSSPDKVADGSTATGAPAAAPATGEAAGTANAGGSEAAAGATPGDVAEQAATQAPGSKPQAGAGTKHPIAAIESGPVGRDGRPLAERASLTLLAPGAVQVGEVADQPAAGKRGGKGGKADRKEKPTAPSGAAAPAPKPVATSATSASATPSTASAKTTKPAAPAGGTSGALHATPDPLPAKPGTTGTAPAHSGPLDRTDATGRVWDPNISRTAPPTQQASRAAQPKPPEVPAPASRLDLPLSFTATPVGEVYNRLAAAHGVRFRIDPGVDTSFPVTVNLQGRRLEDALALVAGQARHRVRRIADGSYTVVAIGADGALADAPVAEEPLEGGAP